MAMAKAAIDPRHVLSPVQGEQQACGCHVGVEVCLLCPDGQRLKERVDAWGAWYLGAAEGMCQEESYEEFAVWRDRHLEHIGARG
ncbi:MAG TPA: hypothetical protein VHZ51_18980 [Ktedonobacteraceae bacterium]|jgi:hypothetical protein|nr:hypothetical protein [Ktedonobacteraceae bacterium]